MIHHSRFDVNLVIKLHDIILSELACLLNLAGPHYKGAPLIKDIDSILMGINNIYAYSFNIYMLRILFP